MNIKLKGMIPKGITLIELIVVMSIIAVSITLATPSMTAFTVKNRITAQVNTLALAIRMARESAITKNNVVTLCRSDNKLQCGGKWHDGMILFVDQNSDHQFNGSDVLITAFSRFPDGDILFWRSFQNRQYLQMSPRGTTRYQNGTFTYCPKEGLEYARGIIINAAGRVKFTKDNDGDGIDEGADRRPLRC
ncbi:MAG: prepilin-type N-terminal cleavage/methylation domain-containing protein [Gammaproteobacteria bacterium]|nr:prepilin-type N-terminal cleavage/methylation domain-containing protein [Gammaproteobacteria bacterium]